jgi:hypothetical protein
MVRTVAVLIVGIPSLVALMMITTLLASSLASPILPGHESAHVLEGAALLLTLVAVVLAWARFAQRTRRRSA